MHTKVSYRNLLEKTLLLQTFSFPLSAILKSHSRGFSYERKKKKSINIRVSPDLSVQLIFLPFILATYNTMMSARVLVLHKHTGLLLL